MDEMNPQIESSLDGLADLVCESLQNGSQELGDRHEGLLKTLLMSGYHSQSDASLVVDLEDRVKDRCREPSMHRGGALSSITTKLNGKFKELAQWESRSPDDKPASKAANISSATDA